MRRGLKRTPSPFLRRVWARVQIARIDLILAVLWLIRGPEVPVFCPWHHKAYYYPRYRHMVCPECSHNGVDNSHLEP